MLADWPRFVAVVAVVGDWLASDDAAWLPIVNRLASAADERGLFAQRIRCSGSAGEAPQTRSWPET
ncbi:hypothetical protein CQY20_29215 [Mycolicibacterium agri]|uniref:Uncharacterized protein n=1 Tax=Mycolicibacterium agri TaxID=36811 RepID=A0A2A7MPZ0_MYCAG|nr:hypothetical protein CQY20_29215 [Mycolicibacterium agri]